jgi:hypothetical protein
MIGQAAHAWSLCKGSRRLIGKGKGGSDQLYKYPTAFIVYDFVIVFSNFKVIIHVC